MFMKSYYEWMESEGNPVGEARALFDHRDIDNTTEAFLQHFQKKYLYGIPFNVIINKRFLLKHILDVYRSKGSINCYKLLFRLIYNQDVEVYLPGLDILKPSDGTWVEPKYIEVTASPLLNDFIGQKVIGISSRVTAVIESYTREPINKNIIYTLNISNITPPRRDFIIGEKIILADSPITEQEINDAPTIIGSLHHVNITNGGEDFNGHAGL